MGCNKFKRVSYFRFAVYYRSLNPIRSNGYATLVILATVAVEVPWLVVNVEFDWHTVEPVS